MTIIRTSGGGYGFQKDRRFSTAVMDLLIIYYLRMAHRMYVNHLIASLSFSSQRIFVSLPGDSIPAYLRLHVESRC